MSKTPEKFETEYVPMDFGNVLETSLRYWIKNLKSYFALFFIAQFAIIVFGYGAFFLSGGNYLVLQFAGYLGIVIPYWLISYFPPSFLAIGLAITVIIVVIINLLIQVFLGGMVIQHTADFHANLSPTFSGSFNQARNRFWSIIGAQILLVLIVTGIGLGTGLLMAVFGFGLFFLGPIGMLVGILLGAVLMTVLLVYVTIRLTVVVPSVILGGETAIGSIDQSWRLVRGNWWRTFGITFIIGIVNFAIGIPASIITSLALTGIYSPQLTIIGIITFAITNAVIAGITGPLGTSTSTMIYHDLMGRQYVPIQLGQPSRVHAYTECPVCGRPVSPGDRFCGQCGRELDID
ncbi:MAG: glycerophosphoryl diester phosphodiesterase membrane domain-containing protein [Candidatus Thorarchaeota archaeon]